jgi:hypothetical protein
VDNKTRQEAFRHVKIVRTALNLNPTVNLRAMALQTLLSGILADARDPVCTLCDTPNGFSIT